MVNFELWVFPRSYRGACDGLSAVDKARLLPPSPRTPAIHSTMMESIFLKWPVMAAPASGL